MVVITNIYTPFSNEISSTHKMVESFERHGYELAIGTKFRGNGTVLKSLYEIYKRAESGHELYCYSDGADTFCQREFRVPDDYILYSTEKACYPHPEWAGRHPNTDSPWRFLNGGGHCGPLKLIIEFNERYGLLKHEGEANGQKEQMDAFFKAYKDGFPIKLDFNCDIFQTTAFEDKGDFRIEGNQIHNNITGSHPAILHGNGRTPMKWIYDLWN